MTTKDFSAQYCYQQLSFTDFSSRYETSIPKARLFELSLSWLAATNAFMLEPADKLVVHCLFNTKAIVETGGKCR